MPSTTTAVIVTRTAAVYVLAGAGAKLAWGTPADLPAILRDNAHDGLDLLFRYVIGIELFVALTALVAPRLGWPLVVAALTVFLGVLVTQLREGAASCGCFGSSVTVPPWIMLAADGVLLLALLAVRPWRWLAETPWRPWSLAVGAAGTVAGVGLLGVVNAVPDTGPPVDPTDAPTAAVTGGPARGPTPPGPSTTDPAPVLPDDATDPTPWRLPRTMPRYVILAPTKWIGQRLAATPLATWANVASFPETATLIFYYDTCDHCAEHLRSMAEDPGRTDYVLIQLPTSPTSRHPRVVDVLPPGQHVKLPLGTKWIIETPWDVLVKDRIVIDAIKGF